MPIPPDVVSCVRAHKSRRTSPIPDREFVESGRGDGHLLHEPPHAEDCESKHEHHQDGADRPRHQHQRRNRHSPPPCFRLLPHRSPLREGTETIVGHGPDGTGTQTREGSYRRVWAIWCTRTQQAALGRLGEGLGHRGPGQSEGRSPVAWELRPMIEAGAPSTKEVALVHSEVLAPPGMGMIAPPEVARNASEARAQCEGRAQEGPPKARPRTV
jgi:hypothetical protein